MKKKINLNITLISLFSILASSIVLTLVYYSLFQSQVMNDLKKTAVLISDSNLFIDVDKKDDLRFDFSKDLSEELRITWVSKDGDILFDNESKTLENHSDRPEIIEAKSEGEGRIIRRSKTLDLNTYYYALRLDNGTILRLSCDAKSITSVFMTALPIVVVISLLIFILAYFLGRKLTFQIIKPINDMAENLEGNISEVEYEELKPFADKILSQHEKILEAAQMRQDFTANVSHELKTPLTAISGYGQLIENEMVDSSQLKTISKEIRFNAERLLSLINDVIKLSELDYGKDIYDFKKVDLYETTENVLLEIEGHAKNKNVSLHLSGKKTIVKGNEDLLSELVENIVSNAIRYNVPSGMVNIKVDTVNNAKIIEVSDTGIGIPKESLDRIFERFYRVDKSRSRKTGGTGLGLAIVKHIAQIHMAQIEVESVLNEGTTIKVIFN